MPSTVFDDDERVPTPPPLVPWMLEDGEAAALFDSPT